MPYAKDVYSPQTILFYYMRYASKAPGWLLFVLLLLLTRCGADDNEPAPSPTGPAPAQEYPQDQQGQNPLTLAVENDCCFIIKNTSAETVDLRAYKLEKTGLDLKLEAESQTQTTDSTVYVLNHKEYLIKDITLSGLAGKDYLEPSEAVTFTIELQYYPDQLEHATLQCKLAHAQYPTIEVSIHYEKKCEIPDFDLSPQSDNTNNSMLTFPSTQPDNHIASWDVAVYTANQKPNSLPSKCGLIYRQNLPKAEDSPALTLEGLGRDQVPQGVSLLMVVLFGKDAQGKVLGVKQKVFAIPF